MRLMPNPMRSTTFRPSWPRVLPVAVMLLIACCSPAGKHESVEKNSASTPCEINRLHIGAATTFLNPENGHYYSLYTLPTSHADGLFPSEYDENGNHLLGHMVTITSQSEFDFVHITMGVTETWIAASDASVDRE